ATICEGESYPLGSQNPTTTGVYTEVFTTSEGCDSTVILNLTVNPILTETIDAEICDGDSYSFDGQDLTVGGVYTTTLISSLNCDSIVTLNLTVNPILTETVDATICDGDSYSFDGQDLTVGGIYT